MNYLFYQEVADYLNNKFGDDYTIAEVFPYWLDDLNRPSWIMRWYDGEKEELEIPEPPAKPQDDVKYKCLCEAMDDIIMEQLPDLNDEMPF